MTLRKLVNFSLAHLYKLGGRGGWGEEHFVSYCSLFLHGRDEVLRAVYRDGDYPAYKSGDISESDMEAARLVVYPLLATLRFRVWESEGDGTALEILLNYANGLEEIIRRDVEAVRGAAVEKKVEVQKRHAPPGGAGSDVEEAALPVPGAAAKPVVQKTALGPGNGGAGEGGTAAVGRGKFNGVPQVKRKVEPGAGGGDVRSWLEEERQEAQNKTANTFVGEDGNDMFNNPRLGFRVIGKEVPRDAERGLDIRDGFPPPRR